MVVQPIKTRRIMPGACTLTDLLDEAVHDMPPRSVLAITSKVASLCEGRVVPIEGTDKQALVQSEAEYYVPETIENKYDYHFTINQHALVSNAGIDESNASGVYVLWPHDPQMTANAVRQYLTDRFGHDQVGVIITDSAVRPMRRGASGIALAFSGLKPLHNYVGQPDLFGRPFKVEQADIVGGLAGAAVLLMGEGAESTPLALIQDLTFVEFVPRDPSEEELASVRISLEDDLFAPFLQRVRWQPGGQNHK